MISIAPRVTPPPQALVPTTPEPPSLLAEHLARVFGTEEDPVNCAFYFKVGVCRHGDMCSKKHNRPTSSRTLLLTNMYPNPPEAIAIGNEEPWDDEMYDRAQAHVEAFYEEVVLVLSDYGEIEEVVVVDNTIEYQSGNVYVKYYHENAAERALKGLTGRFYFGKLISAEYSPVTDFREARCRAFHETRCSRGGSCRFLHIKHIPTAVKRRVARQMYDEHPEYVTRAHDKYQKERSRSRRRTSGRDRDRDRDRRREPRALRDRDPMPALMDAQPDSKGGGGGRGSDDDRRGRTSPDRRRDGPDDERDGGRRRDGHNGSRRQRSRDADRASSPRDSTRDGTRDGPADGHCGEKRSPERSGGARNNGSSGTLRDPSLRGGGRRRDSREPPEDRNRRGDGGRNRDGRRSLVVE